MKTQLATLNEPSSLRSRAARILVFVAAYLACAFAGRFLSSPAVHFVNFWLPGGLFVGMLLRQETRRWPELVASAFLTNIFFDWWNGQQIETDLFFATGNCLEALTGAWLIRHWVTPRPNLAKVKEVGGLVGFSAGLSTMVGATVGALAIGVTTGQGFSLVTWLFWWSGDALGILLVAPLVLAWPKNFHGWSAWKGSAGTVEALALGFGTATIVFFAFYEAVPPGHSVKYLVIPCVLWAAFRSGVFATALNSLLAAGFACWMTTWAAGAAAIGGLSATELLASLQLFLAVVALTGLFLAAVLAERGAVEVALRASEKRYQLVERAVDDGMWDWNILTDEAYLSPRWKKILGYGPDELPDNATAHFDNIHPDDAALAHESVRRHLEENTRYAVELRLRHKDGSYRWIYTRGEAIRDVSGRPVRMVGAITDITERKRVIEALRESEEKFEKVFRDVPVWIVLTDVATSAVLEVNDCALKAGGFSRDEVIGHSGAELGWMKAENRAAIVKTLSDHGRVENLEMWFRTRDGRELCGLVSGELIVIGGRTCSLTATVDITARKQAEAALKESEEKFRQIAENIHEVFWVYDLVLQKVLYVSPAYAAIWGRPIEGFLANPLDWIEGVHPEDRVRLVKATRAPMATGEAGDVFRIVRPDGRIRWIRNLSFSVLDGAGAVVRVVGTAEDITERRELEQQLRRSQKLEAIGTLAGGIAHDFNNILAGISGFNSLARQAVQGNAELLDYLDEIGRAGRRAADLVKQILAFSRVEDQALGPLQMRYVVAEAVKLLRATIPSSVDFEVLLAADLPAVQGNSTQLHQVVMNLGTNAWHAMRDRAGKLRIVLEACAVDERLAQVLTGISPGPHVRLEVSDTGSGMDMPTQERIFEPFFTTKAPGEGTGLGLSVVHGIVRNHHGAIRLRSELGQGTSIEIFLPAITAAPIRAEVETAELPPGRGERILFVDDEDFLVRLGEKTLTRLGYQVDGESQVLQALARVENDPQAYDLIITDQTMPRMSGLEFATKVRSVRADLPVLVVSGYSTALTPDKIQAAGVGEVLSKPFSTTTLAQAIRRHLPSHS